MATRTLSRLTARVLDVDDSGSLSAWARGRRWRRLAERFPLADMDVLDLGGTVASWAKAPVRPRSVVVLNFDSRENPGEADEAGFEVVVGDACDPPAEVRARHFDLVYSNSVLEHVGGAARRREFADVVRDAADHHWIQTPYRYFPLEPHFLFPGFQLLPLRLKAEVTRRWRFGHYYGVESLEDAIHWSLATELVSLTEMRHLFPASRIEHERVAGLTKSLVATA